MVSLEFLIGTMAPESTEPLRDIGISSISCRPVLRADNLSNLHVPVVWKPGSFNFLEHSWPVQACAGIALSQSTKTMVRDVTLVILATAMCHETLKVN